MEDGEGPEPPLDEESDDSFLRSEEEDEAEVEGMA